VNTDPSNVFPTIAEVGSPATAFTGPNISSNNCNQPSIKGRDQPSVASSATIGCNFLTDDGIHQEGAGEPQTVLFIEYSQPVGQASGDIIDTDGPEAWKIEAYSVPNPTFADQPINTFVICGDTYSPQSDCAKTESEDGAATGWTLAGVCPSLIRSIAISYIGNPQTPARNVGLGFDNFDANTGACIPPQLSIQKTANGAPWQAGGTGSYNVTVTATGGAIAPNTTITIDDNSTFPSPPLNLTSMTTTAPGWDCTTTPGQCSLTVGGTPIQPGTVWSFTVNTDIDADYPGGTVQNCAVGTLQNTGQGILVHDTDCANVEILPQPPVVSIQKQALGIPWQAGGTGTFQVTVTTSANIPTGQAIAVLDVIPSGLTLVPGSITPSNLVCVAINSTCYLNGPLAAGTYNFTFDVQISETCNTYKNCADIDVTDAIEFNAAGTPVDTSLPEFSSMGQSCVEVPVSVTNQCTPAALHIEKSHSPTTFTNGGTGTITIAVSNTGDPVIAPIQVNETLPAGLTIVPPGPFSPAPNIACIAGPILPTSQQVHCAYMGNSGGNFSFDLQVNVNAGVVKGVVNHAAVIKGCCGEAPNDTAEDTIPINSHGGGSETGKICGHKFNDLNSNGIWDHGIGAGQPETGLAGWDITVTDTNGNLVGTATTDASGHYCIAVPVSSMLYTVTENVQSQGNNWVQTAPAVPYHVTIPAANLVAEGNNFGNKWIESHARGDICGHKYLGEGINYPLSGWVVTAEGVGGSFVNTATTNEKGEYCIKLPPGMYTVSEQIPTMNNVVWTPISPASGTYSNVWLGPSASVNGIDFHNIKQEIGPAGLLPPRPAIDVTKSHSPRVFSTGGKGTFTIKVANMGKTLTRGMIRVTDHMPAGLSVKTGKFVADLWTCEGGKVTRNGQDVTCVFNKTLRKNRWSAIKLNTSIASNDRFPAGVDVIRNCATASVQKGAAEAFVEGTKVCDKVRIRHVDSSGGATLPGVIGAVSSPPNVSIQKKHSPSRFSTGSRGAFKIIVKNRGAAMEKGALTVVDHMPAGLSVKTSTFRAGSWRCKGGMVSGSGQDVTCSYNRTLNRRGRATLNLNVNIAPKSQFPADVKEVENCATASAQGAASVKACDRVRINRTRSSETIDLAPLGGLIMQIPHGGGRPVRKVPGAVP